VNKTQTPNIFSTHASNYRVKLYLQELRRVPAQHKTSPNLRGSSHRKSAKSANFFFWQKKGLYMWVNHVPKYYEASSTRNPRNGGQKGVGGRGQKAHIVMYLYLYDEYSGMKTFVYLFLSIYSDHKSKLCMCTLHE